MNYITVADFAKKWGISERRVRVLCSEGQIPGAFNLGKVWNIPADAVKPKDNRFKHKKTVLVFGGYKAVGLEIVKQCLALDCVVYSLGEKPCEEPGVINLVCKSLDKNSIIKALEGLEDLDVLFLYPSIYDPVSIDNLTEEMIDKTLELNVKACAYIMSAVAKKLRDSRGNVVVMSSSAGINAEPASPLYCTSHAALIMLAKCAAISEAKYNVRVNTIAMGAPDDAQTIKNYFSETEIVNMHRVAPMKNMIKNGDAADAAIYLSGLTRQNVNKITGVVLPVDCGESIASGYAFEEVK